MNYESCCEGWASRWVLVLLLAHPAQAYLNRSYSTLDEARPFEGDFNDILAQGKLRILLTRVAAEGGLPAGLTADPDAYDAWFRAKVQEALDDPRPATPHAQVMQDAQALIDGKRRAGS